MKSKKHINVGFLLLFLMSVANLLFLHHYFLQTIGLEVGCFKSSLVDNLLACLLDHRDQLAGIIAGEFGDEDGVYVSDHGKLLVLGLAAAGTDKFPWLVFGTDAAEDKDHVICLDPVVAMCDDCLVP